MWIDYKCFIKRKLTKNKLNVSATGGGASSEISLTPLEQDVADLLNFKKSVNPAGKTFGKKSVDSINNNGNDIANRNVEETMESLLSTAEEPIEIYTTTANFDENEEQEQPGKSSNFKRRRTISNSAGFSLENERLSLLKQQTEAQELLLKAQQQIAENTASISISLKKLIALKEMETLNKKKMQYENSKMVELNMKIKTKKLELLEQQIKMQQNQEL